MPRAPFQVAIFPFHKNADRRSDEGYWQSIAGGGEDQETSLDAACRETWEEAGLPVTCRFYPLSTCASAPVIHFRERHHWDEKLFVIPIHYFGVDATDSEIHLSQEHSEYQWVVVENGLEMLRWDSDKTALWELEHILRSLNSNTD